MQESIVLAAKSNSREYGKCKFDSHYYKSCEKISNLAGSAEIQCFYMVRSIENYNKVLRLNIREDNDRLIYRPCNIIMELDVIEEEREKKTVKRRTRWGSEENLHTCKLATWCG